MEVKNTRIYMGVKYYNIEMVGKRDELGNKLKRLRFVLLIRDV